MNRGLGGGRRRGCGPSAEQREALEVDQDVRERFRHSRKASVRKDCTVRSVSTQRTRTRRYSVRGTRVANVTTGATLDLFGSRGMEVFSILSSKPERTDEIAAVLGVELRADHRSLGSILKYLSWQ